MKEQSEATNEVPKGLEQQSKNLKKSYNQMLVMQPKLSSLIESCLLLCLAQASTKQGFDPNELGVCACRKHCCRFARNFQQLAVDGVKQAKK